MVIVLILAGIIAFVLLVRWVKKKSPDLAAMSDEALSEEAAWHDGYGDRESKYHLEIARRSEVTTVASAAAVAAQPAAQAEPEQVLVKDQVGGSLIAVPLVIVEP